MLKRIRDRCKVFIVLLLIALFVVLVAVPVSGVHHGKRFILRKMSRTNCPRGTQEVEFY